MGATRTKAGFPAPYEAVSGVTGRRSAAAPSGHLTAPSGRYPSCRYRPRKCTSGDGTGSRRDRLDGGLDQQRPAARRGARPAGNRPRCRRRPGTGPYSVAVQSPVAKRPPGAGIRPANRSASCWSPGPSGVTAKPAGRRDRVPELALLVDQPQHAAGIAVGDQHRGDGQTGRAGRGPQGDGRGEAPAQPPYRRTCPAPGWRRGRWSGSAPRARPVSRETFCRPPVSSRVAEHRVPADLAPVLATAATSARAGRPIGRPVLRFPGASAYPEGDSDDHPDPRRRGPHRRSARDFRVLTGDRPTGPLHLGHFFGTLRNRVRLQHSGVELVLVVADYQVLTDRDVAERLAPTVDGLILDYLAAGLDPARATIFTHSAVPALNQLAAAVPQPGHASPSCSATRRSRTRSRTPGRRAVSGLMFTYPGASGRRHPVLQGQPGAGRPGPAAAPRGHPHGRPALQRALRDGRSSPCPRRCSAPRRCCSAPTGRR